MRVKATPSNNSGLTKHGVGAEYPFGDWTDLAGCDMYLDIIKLSHNRLVLARFYTMKGSDYCEHIGLLLVLLDRLVRGVVMLLVA